MNETAPRACVIGFPIRHSRSPLIHGYWLAELGIPGSYGMVEVVPGTLSAFLRDLPGQGYVGCNVTVPHKETAYRLLDGATDRARALRAVNTIWLEDGRLQGDNTDIEGFLANLDQEAPGWDASRGTAIVLGAGGAARAVVFGLGSRGFRRIVVVNRNLERARELANWFGRAAVPAGWEDLPALLPDADLLVNTTSLGMQGQPELQLDLAPLKPGAVVSDIVYVPLETGLLRQARARGHRVVDGLGMLLHQAVPGFAHWFGRRPSVTPELRARIVADIESGR
jgi:shikimate dehydrogenase